jgi:uncharacterized repeat protein (TIGR01451 family)
VGIAVAASGSVSITGQTDSTNFPTTAGAFQRTFGGSFEDAFVTRLDPSGSALVYSTYLGGNGLDAGNGIAVDASGNAYVIGLTGSTDFPTTAGAFQTASHGGNPNCPCDAFVTKLNATGTGLVYSTYLGGSGEERGRGIAVDASGDAYVTGTTASTDFPATPGAFQTTFGGINDVFVTKLNPSGSGLVYSTYLGGSGDGGGSGIAVDASGNAYVVGSTASTDFPTTAGAFQTAFGGGQDDAFVTKLNPSGSAPVYSTYLGGSDTDGSSGIAVDASGNAYVIGGTLSTDFPTTAGAFQRTFGGGVDAFVAKISVNTPSGASVTASAGNGVTVTFTSVAIPGETTAPTSSTGPTPPAGFSLGNPPTYYNITTTATFVPPVSVCITYNPAQFGDPTALHLLHFQNNAWVDVTTSNDTTNHVICGSVTSLSPFAIFQKLLLPADLAIGKGGPSTISSGSNLTYGIGVVNLGPNTASGVVVTDPIPAGTTFVSAQYAKGSCTVSNGRVTCPVPQQGTPCSFGFGIVTCNIGTLSPYTPANPTGAGVQLVVHVTASRGATITNTATVSASNPDPNQANNSSTATTSVR